jgi:anti-anti-sigma regulatory factor
MAANTGLLEIRAAGVAQCLLEASKKLDGANGEMVLDFSSVQQVDATALKAMDELAQAAKQKATTVVLRGVNVNVYKVLKLVRLAPRFSFRPDSNP